MHHLFLHMEEILLSQSTQIVSHFLSHRNVTIELTEKISKNHYSYKPTETSMSAEELVKHILTTFHLFANVIKEGNASPFQTSRKKRKQISMFWLKRLQKKRLPSLSSSLRNTLTEKLT